MSDFTKEEIELYIKDRAAWLKSEELKFEAQSRKLANQIEIDILESIIKYTRQRRPDLVKSYRELLKEHRAIWKQA